MKSSAAPKLQGFFAPTPRVLHFLEVPDPEAPMLERLAGKAVGRGTKRLRPAARDIVADLIRREFSTRTCRQWKAHSWCAVAVETWSRELGWSPRTIRRALRELQRAGIVYRHRRYRRNRKGNVRERTAITRIAPWARTLFGMPDADGAGQLQLVGQRDTFRDRMRGPATFDQVLVWKDTFNSLNRSGALDRHGITWRSFYADRLKHSGCSPAHVAEAVNRSAAVGGELEQDPPALPPPGSPRDS